MIQITQAQENLLLNGDFIYVMMSPSPLEGSLVILQSPNERYMGYVDSVVRSSVGPQTKISL